jgi:hypothetical protein
MTWRCSYPASERSSDFGGKTRGNHGLIWPLEVLGPRSSGPVDIRQLTCDATDLKCWQANLGSKTSQNRPRQN